MLWNGIYQKSEKYHNDFCNTPKVSQEIKQSIFLSGMWNSSLIQQQHNILKQISVFVRGFKKSSWVGLPNIIKCVRFRLPQLYNGVLGGNLIDVKWEKFWTSLFLVQQIRAKEFLNGESGLSIVDQEIYLLVCDVDFDFYILYIFLDLKWSSARSLSTLKNLKFDSLLGIIWPCALKHEFFAVKVLVMLGIWAIHGETLLLVHFKDVYCGLSPRKIFFSALFRSKW